MGKTIVHCRPSSQWVLEIMDFSLIGSVENDYSVCTSGLHFQSLRSLCFVTHRRCALITELRPSVLDLTCMWLTRKRCQKDLTYRYCMICREILPSGWAVHWLSLIWALAKGIKSKVRPWISYMYRYMCACHWISFAYLSNLSWCCIFLFFYFFFYSQCHQSV